VPDCRTEDRIVDTDLHPAAVQDDATSIFTRLPGVGHGSSRGSSRGAGGDRCWGRASNASKTASQRSTQRTDAELAAGCAMKIPPPPKVTTLRPCHV
jgi:hypothetical protein